MSLLYNAIAGKGLERIAGLSDGVFAVAMTLIVLDIRVPETPEITSNAQLYHALLHLAPRLLMYAMSFLTLGIFWTGQQTQLSQMRESDRNFTWIHFGFLAVLSLLPFSTTLIAEHIGLQLALFVYWLNILLGGIMTYVGWHYAMKAGLVKHPTPELDRTLRRRIVIAQLLYALGLLLSVFGTALSLTFIVVVQLNYALAPKIRWLYRL